MKKKRGRFEDVDDGICFADRVADKEYTATEFEGRSLLNTTIIDGDHLRTCFWITGYPSGPWRPRHPLACGAERTWYEHSGSPPTSALATYRGFPVLSYGQWCHTNGCIDVQPGR